ncbi:hypothetical protein [Vibrio cholerae]|uniref:hypothetical protein n=1 Tax=Vibrio cholerae TaxID=666 RepID=UPI0020C78B0C|nr:hypothetical protein [Vibrio cholerae]
MSTIVFRNSQEAFIHKNVLKILLSEGHEEINANRGADFSVEVYRSTASFGRGGQVLRILPRPSPRSAAASQKECRKNQAHTE